MASYKLLFLFFFFIHFLNSATTDAAEPTYVSHNCTTDKTFTETDAYQASLRDLLNWLSSNATGETMFYNATTTVDTINSTTRKTVSYQSSIITHVSIGSTLASSKASVVNGSTSTCGKGSAFKDCTSSSRNSSVGNGSKSTPRNATVGTGSRSASSNSTVDVNRGPSASSRERTSDSSDTIYGLFMCSGYVTPLLCHQCVRDATAQLSFKYCNDSKEAIIWYDECMVRYSNRFFFSTVDTGSVFYDSNTTHVNVSDDKSFMNLLLDTMSATADEAAKLTLGGKNYATNQANISSSQTLYCVAQCTPDLSPEECRSCLSATIGEIPVCCTGKEGGKVLYPSCRIRYELYPFYNFTADSSDPPDPGTHAYVYERGIGKLTMIRAMPITGFVILIIVVGLGILFCLACYFLRKKVKKGCNTILKEIFGDERTAFLESLQFSLATIEVATDRFSQQNKIGRGGFGEVYKGILCDRQEIAIKRLSSSSGQGVVEFKNEVLLMAKLQHKNLVTLLGFCLEGEEKMLIYEYVPNNSLDYFLFGTQKTRSLNWSERHKIIEGIAQGILYLHKYSRLKIIHRDLKPSNVLLDNNMNPKISDFGISRMVGIDETQGNTNRVVGTFGYMSPEYVLCGQFSERSDVFSYGVMVLEIISGKKNANCPHSQCVDDLLSYAWKQWRDENTLELLDPSMTEVGSQSEMIRCIHIGLLCVQRQANVRPSMITVVQYLNNDSMELPSPEEPAFFPHNRMELRNIEANGEQGSINQMTISEFFPR